MTQADLASHSRYERTFVAHAYPEQVADLGEVAMNYAVAGSVDRPALLLIPGQTESWWGYEAAMQRLAADFEVFAVDLRGQGRSSWTPGRYTLDNMGGDLVRFLDLVVKRPAIVSGCSSGGVLSCWLAAYAMPGQLRGALLEDPPLFASELTPVCGHSIRQSVVGPMFGLYRQHLGEQWRIGDFAGMREAAASAGMRFPIPEAPGQNLKEYDPEWAKAFYEGTVGAGCPHQVMLSHVKSPVLLTQHFRMINEETGVLFGALSDLQAKKAEALITAAGAPYAYRSLPDAAHAMHAADPERYVGVLKEWAATL